jgi:PilZ domain
MEKRSADRYRVLKAGTIEFDGAATNCMVRNKSNLGAALHVASPVGIPDPFTLVLQPDGHHAPCHVVWRKEKRIGIAFDWGFMVEQRAIARTKISKNALLFFNEQHGVFACNVHDIAKGGAGIHLQDLNVLPLNFELTFDNFHNIHRCKVIWRRGDFVGVQFQDWESSDGLPI